MHILGIESSCDETSIAIVNENRKIVAHKLISQIDLHKAYGGVVPEIAARAHIDVIKPMIEEALKEAGLKLSQIDGIAVTSGPGLIGGLIIGVMIAKGLSFALNIPLIGVNHLEGHALTIRLSDGLAFPYLLLLVSGGHCQFIEVETLGKYKILGKTIDDSVGEAFDKVSKMLGFGYPGGPIIEKMAKHGDAKRFALPKPLHGQDNCNFSFSGLKTAVKRLIDSLHGISEQDKADICASFQSTVADVICDRAKNAMDLYCFSEKNLVLAGGVASNLFIRSRLEEACKIKGFALHAPPIQLCTDNAAMIAWTGLERLKAGFSSNLELTPQARWALDNI